MRLPETLPPAGALEHRDAAGRNWTRERPARRRLGKSKAGGQPYPVRELGGGDHDMPFEFQRPSTAWPFPFTTRQLGRLLALRGRIQDGAFQDDLSC